MLMTAIAPAYGVMMLATLVAYALIPPAVERSVLKPQNGARAGFLKLGAAYRRLARA